MGQTDNVNAILQNEMIENQLKGRGIKDKNVLSAFEKVDRSLFVPAEIRSSSYDDVALPIGNDQTISQPYMVAIMTELLKLKGDEKVLEIGTGSGFQTAILSELARKVISIERVPNLASKAETLLSNLGLSNIKVIVGDGSEGHIIEAPYDGIIVTAGCPEAPKPLIDQLAEGGRLVLPIGDRYSQILTVIEKIDGEIKTTSSISCMFVPLIGKYGWKS